MKSKVYLLLLIITIFGGFLRFYRLSDYPVSLNTDEVTFAYNAFSILNTARDEYGEFMPITFKSVGDYKNPVPTYLLVPSIKLFGLNELGVRFPFALIATLAIPLVFLLSFQITKNYRIAIIAAILTAISPWHIFYSRFGSDQQMAMVIFGYGILFFLKMLGKRQVHFAISSATLVTLSMYTYYIERILVPLMVLLLCLLNFGAVRKNMKLFAIFISICILVVSPLFIRTFFGPDLARGGMVFIAKDVDFTRNINVSRDSGVKLGTFDLEENLALSFFIIKRYLNYFQSDFLFFTGLNMTHEGSLGLGVTYLFELPFLILGLWVILKNKKISKGIIFGWITLGLLPAAFTNNDQNPSRTIVVLPMLVLISAIGAHNFINLLNYFRYRLISYSIFSIFILIILTHAFLTYTVHLPIDRGEYSFYGIKEAVTYAIENQEKYREIVFDPIRGVAAPNIYGLPQAYVLFYSSYDPMKYQQEEKDKNGVFGFDKYKFRPIYWPDDRDDFGTLFIGSPWSLPLKDIKDEEILKRIYLKNGDLAFLVVSPKAN